MSFHQCKEEWWACSFLLLQSYYLSLLFLTKFTGSVIEWRNQKLGSSLGSITKSFDPAWFSSQICQVGWRGEWFKSLGILSLARFYLLVLGYVYVKIEDTFPKARTLTEFLFLLALFICLFIIDFWPRYIQKWERSLSFCPLLPRQCHFYLHLFIFQFTSDSCSLR